LRDAHEPFEDLAGFILNSAEYIEAHVNSDDFRVWAHNKWPGDKYPEATKTLLSGVTASIILFLTLIGCFSFYFATIITRAVKDETGQILERFMRIAQPAVLILLTSLMVGLFFSFNFLVNRLELRVSSVKFSHDIKNIYALSLSIGPLLISLTAVAGFLYSYGIQNRCCRKRRKPSCTK
jgi:hypothetical protein